MSGTTRSGCRKRAGGSEARAVGGRELRWSARRKAGVGRVAAAARRVARCAGPRDAAGGRMPPGAMSFLAAGPKQLKSRLLPVKDRRMTEAQRNVPSTPRRKILLSDDHIIREDIGFG